MAFSFSSLPSIRCKNIVNSAARFLIAILDVSTNSLYVALFDKQEDPSLIGDSLKWILKISFFQSASYEYSKYPPATKFRSDPVTIFDLMVGGGVYEMRGSNMQQTVTASFY